LRAKADVVKTDLSERIKALVDSGDITGMSIGMIVGKDNSRIERRGLKPHRTIQNFKRILMFARPSIPLTRRPKRSSGL
jgi:phage head maturation protease